MTQEATTEPRQQESTEKHKITLVVATNGEIPSPSYNHITIAIASDNVKDGLRVILMLATQRPTWYGFYSKRGDRTLEEMRFCQSNQFNPPGTLNDAFHEFKQHLVEKFKEQIKIIICPANSPLLSLPAKKNKRPKRQKQKQQPPSHKNT